MGSLVLMLIYKPMLQLGGIMVHSTFMSSLWSRTAFPWFLPTGCHARKSPYGQQLVVPARFSSWSRKCSPRWWQAFIPVSFWYQTAADSRLEHPRYIWQGSPLLHGNSTNGQMLSGPSGLSSEHQFGEYLLPYSSQHFLHFAYKWGVAEPTSY